MILHSNPTDWIKIYICIWSDITQERLVSSHESHLTFRREGCTENSRAESTLPPGTWELSWVFHCVPPDCCWRSEAPTPSGRSRHCRAQQSRSRGFPCNNRRLYCFGLRLGGGSKLTWRSSSVQPRYRTWWRARVVCSWRTSGWERSRVPCSAATQPPGPGQCPASTRTSPRCGASPGWTGPTTWQ